MVSTLAGTATVRDPFPVEAGSPTRWGPRLLLRVNFSLSSSMATGVRLLLFSTPDALEPFQTIQFDPYVNKTFPVTCLYAVETGRTLRVPR
jgi:hypothetical protein